jgi:hypothetical protein
MWGRAWLRLGWSFIVVGGNRTSTQCCIINRQEFRLGTGTPVGDRSKCSANNQITRLLGEAVSDALKQLLAAQTCLGSIPEGMHTWVEDPSFAHYTPRRKCHRTVT